MRENIDKTLDLVEEVRRKVNRLIYQMTAVVVGLSIILIAIAALIIWILLS